MIYHVAYVACPGGFAKSQLSQPCFADGACGAVRGPSNWPQLFKSGRCNMDLNGQLLIAMPGMGDPRFDRSVIFICAYSAEGAMGLILNKPVPDMTVGDVLEQMDMALAGGPVDAAVHIGGPVQTERGFVLHNDILRVQDDPLVVAGGYCVSVAQQVLRDIGQGIGPDPFLFALGYSGWGPAQLDEEIAQNGWLTAPASDALLFDTSVDQLWEEALGSIGIDPVSLSGVAGRA